MEDTTNERLKIYSQAVFPMQREYDFLDKQDRQTCNFVTNEVRIPRIKIIHIFLIVISVAHVGL